MTGPPLASLVPLAAVAATLWLRFVAARSWHVRRRALRRLYDDLDVQPTSAVDEGSAPRRWLTRWLTVAGYRRPNALAFFVAITLTAAIVGLLAGAFYRAQLLDAL